MWEPRGAAAPKCPCHQACIGCSTGTPDCRALDGQVDVPAHGEQGRHVRPIRLQVEASAVRHARPSEAAVRLDAPLAQLHVRHGGRQLRRQLAKRGFQLRCMLGQLRPSRGGSSGMPVQLAARVHGTQATVRSHPALRGVGFRGGIGSVVVGIRSTLHESQPEGGACGAAAAAADALGHGDSPDGRRHPGLLSAVHSLPAAVTLHPVRWPLPPLLKDCRACATTQIR